jgi:hypothetical protein
MINYIIVNIINIADYEDRASEYSETFHQEEEIGDEVDNKDLNLDEFKEIHEQQKLQTKVNFFDSSSNMDVYVKPDPKHIVNRYKIDQKDRLPRDISTNNINKLNSLYEKYNAMKLNQDEQLESLGSLNNNLHKHNKSIVRTENSEKKYNPISDLDNEDTLINDLTKLRKIALNEINQ